MGLQLASLLITVCGLLIAYVEVIRPRTADQIESVLFDLASIRYPPVGQGVRPALAWRLFIAIEVAAMLGTWVYLLAGPGLDQFLWLRQAARGTRLGLLWALLAVSLLFALTVLPIVVPMLLLNGLAGAIRLLNRVSGGRGLGIVGLLIAVLAVLVGAVQTVVMSIGR